VHPIALASQPVRQHVCLLVYCDGEYELHWLELGTFAASLWNFFEEQPPLGQAVNLALTQSVSDGQAPSLEAVSALLADLCRRGLIVS